MGSGVRRQEIALRSPRRASRSGQDDDVLAEAPRASLSLATVGMPLPTAPKRRRTRRGPALDPRRRGRRRRRRLTLKKKVESPSRTGTPRPLNRNRKSLIGLPPSPRSGGRKRKTTQLASPRTRLTLTKRPAGRRKRGEDFLHRLQKKNPYLIVKWQKKNPYLIVKWSVSLPRKRIGRNQRNAFWL